MRSAPASVSIVRAERKPPPRLTIGEKYLYRQFKNTCGGLLAPPAEPVLLWYYNPNYPKLCRVKLPNGVLKMVSTLSLELAP